MFTFRTASTKTASTSFAKTHTTETFGDAGGFTLHTVEPISATFKLVGSAELGGDRTIYEDGGFWEHRLNVWKHTCEGSDLSERFSLDPLKLNHVYAHGGQDLVHGGYRKDIIHLGDGDDAAYGYAGDDEIFGGFGNDTVDGGAGNDRINGGTGVGWAPGDDLLRGGDGDDRIYGDHGDDVIHGGRDNDTLNGHTGDDAVYGDEGDDVVQGFQGRDTVDGGDGDDVVEGGAGDDWLWGGDGADVFLFETGETGRDILFDMTLEDRIEIDVDPLFWGDFDVAFDEMGAMMTWTHGGVRQPIEEHVQLLGVDAEMFAQLDLAFV